MAVVYIKCSCVTFLNMIKRKFRNSNIDFLLISFSKKKIRKLLHYKVGCKSKSSMLIEYSIYIFFYIIIKNLLIPKVHNMI